MKKGSLFLFVFFLGLTFRGFSQAPAPEDFFAGKWEIVITGTPNGDAKFITNLVRKDGKLTGEMADPTDATKEKIPLTKIEESSDKLSLYFTAQGYDVNVDLAKVDDDNLKGSLMNMFDAKAKRLKE
ncbi:hypothetical protein ACFQ4C_15585 [Larkinella insperata]|uniref:DUF4488 domain-containing protein n=1 Tax=Larkinella insperata TaxID=332158 RepID=A0ABW3Q5X4_9BACT|nr:hypothetical protein [Larkinella insperata]